MVIDTSALVAIAFGEPEADRLVAAITDARTRLVAAPTLAEATAVVLRRRGRTGRADLARVLAAGDVEVVPMSPHAAELAADAYARYGKGVGSPGVLNFGDCLAYGVAAALGEPLLFKGDDFPRTDIAAARY